MHMASDLRLPSHLKKSALMLLISHPSDGRRLSWPGGRLHKYGIPAVNHHKINSARSTGRVALLMYTIIMYLTGPNDH